MEKQLDYDSIKKAVEALFMSSNTLCLAMRDMKRKIDLNSYLNYEHYEGLNDEIKEIDSKIENLLAMIDEMKEEKEAYELEAKEMEAERKTVVTEMVNPFE